MSMPVSGMRDGWTARVLLLRRPDDSVEIYVPLVEYMCAHPYRSGTWQNDVARAVGLFWDYCQICGHDVMEVAKAGGNQNPHYALLRSFAAMLSNGSDGEKNGLIWARTGRDRTVRLIRAIENFADWWKDEDREAKITLRPGRPDDSLSVTDLLIWARLRNVSMLKHIDRPHQIRRDSVVDFGPSPRGMGTEGYKFFPAAHIERLLWQGHLRPGKESETNPFLKYNVRDQMIALLDGWGGLRRSEGLHLWVQDVVEEPKKPQHALVVLNHPSEARIEIPDGLRGGTVRVTRQEALHRLYQRQPRHLVTRGRYHVGWKSLDLNSDYQAFVYWLDERAGALFWVLYLGYVRHVRRPIMEERKRRGGSDHPFLFVSEGEDRNEDADALIGDPYSAQAYSRNHEAAVRRIGLPHAKNEGTTTHGLRHGYGQALAELGIPPQIIRKGLHHRKFLSQVPYTVPTKERVNEVLSAVSRGEPIPAPPLGHESGRALLDLHNFITGGPTLA
ncbi:hypothetical protein [Bosea sp. ANAM02]|uniref:tyrosine-type recombinase/integrase n=1 Tax=Bosea sp. ANAM02 TaxID=2020412 RepID=UPI0015641BDB|nr:hypothetical protein [Bosea sp. ANAM02]